jgi:hypothetical protein
MYCSEIRDKKPHSLMCTKFVLYLGCLSEKCSLLGRALPRHRTAVAQLWGDIFYLIDFKGVLIFGPQYATLWANR